MIEPEFPSNEAQRQRAVERYQLLDTLPESQYDSITALMAYIAQTPVSLITFLDRDRNFLKSHHGVPFNESPRNISFCGHAINAEQAITIVEDASQDPRFCDNPLVTEQGIRFYAGVPLCTPDEFRLGTLCIFDLVPRTLDNDTKTAIVTLAAQVETLLAQRLNNIILTQLHDRLEEQNEQLQLFGQALSHDLKSPLINITYAADSLLSSHALSSEAREIVNTIHNTAETTCHYADSLLNFYSSDALMGGEIEEVFLGNMFDELELIACQSATKPVVLTSHYKAETVFVQRSALLQILLNLTTNAIKYNDKSSVELNLTVSENNDYYLFSLEDNSCGIPESKLEHIFLKHERLETSNNTPVTGYGLGLCTVAKLVKNLDGTIQATSSPGVGSTFSFSVKKSDNTKDIPNAQIAA